jgi:hypothetical protein
MTRAPSHVSTVTDEWTCWAETAEAPCGCTSSGTVPVFTYTMYLVDDVTYVAECRRCLATVLVFK